MNFNTQLAFIPRAVIAEAREGKASRRLSSRKAKPQVKIDGSIDHGIRVYGPASPPPTPSPCSLVDTLRCRLTRACDYLSFCALKESIETAGRRRVRKQNVREISIIL